LTLRRHRIAEGTYLDVSKALSFLVSSRSRAAFRFSARESDLMSIALPPFAMGKAQPPVTSVSFRLLPELSDNPA